jgi:dTDP-4-amino-4,6-dideoxygalactose transaminase
MKVPFLDLRVSYLKLKDELDEACLRVMDSGWYILGGEVTSFEAAYAGYCEAQHCVGVGECTFYRAESHGRWPGR